MSKIEKAKEKLVAAGIRYARIGVGKVDAIVALQVAAIELGRATDQERIKTIRDRGGL
jgi:hypothetical protein